MTLVIPCNPYYPYKPINHPCHWPPRSASGPLGHLAPRAPSALLCLKLAKLAHPWAPPRRLGPHLCILCCSAAALCCRNQSFPFHSLSPSRSSDPLIALIPPDPRALVPSFPPNSQPAAAASLVLSLILPCPPCPILTQHLPKLTTARLALLPPPSRPSSPCSSPHPTPSCCCPSSSSSLSSSSSSLYRPSSIPPTSTFHPSTHPQLDYCSSPSSFSCSSATPSVYP